MLTILLYLWFNRFTGELLVKNKTPSLDSTTKCTWSPWSQLFYSSHQTRWGSLLVYINIIDLLASYFMLCFSTLRLASAFNFPRDYTEPVVFSSVPVLISHVTCADGAKLSIRCACVQRSDWLIRVLNFQCFGGDLPKTRPLSCWSSFFSVLESASFSCPQELNEVCRLKAIDNNIQM